MYPGTALAGGFGFSGSTKHCPLFCLWTAVWTAVECRVWTPRLRSYVHSSLLCIICPSVRFKTWDNNLHKRHQANTSATKHVQQSETATNHGGRTRQLSMNARGPAAATVPVASVSPLGQERSTAPLRRLRSPASRAADPEMLRPW